MAFVFSSQNDEKNSYPCRKSDFCLPFRSPSLYWPLSSALVNITRTDLQHLGCDCFDWIHLARDMLGFCEYSSEIYIPSSSGNFLSISSTFTWQGRYSTAWVGYRGAVFYPVFPSNIPIRFSAPDKDKIVKLTQCVDKPTTITTYGYQLRSPVTLLREKRP